MGNVIATYELSLIYDELKALKEQKRVLEAKEELLKQQLYNQMLDNENLITDDGELLLTWKYTADTFYLDTKALAEENPDTYNAYTKIREGARRLVLK
jgi:hypothetical protein